MFKRTFVFPIIALLLTSSLGLMPNGSMEQKSSLGVDTGLSSARTKDDMGPSEPVERSGYRDSIADDIECQQLTNENYDQQFPRWNPDYTKILYSSKEAGGSYYDLWCMDSNGGNHLRFSDHQYGERLGVYSIDGKNILYASNEGNMWSDIWIMDNDGSNHREFIATDGGDSNPEIDPTGKLIAFSSAPQDAQGRIYLANSDGTNPHNISPGSATDRFTSPRFSPDGKKIIHASMFDGGDDFDIWVMDSDGSNPEQLTFENHEQRFAIFLPDSSRILYSSKEDGDNIWDIWMMDTDGRNHVQLTNDDFDQVAWDVRQKNRMTDVLYYSKEDKGGYYDIWQMSFPNPHIEQDEFGGSWFDDFKDSMGIDNRKNICVNNEKAILSMASGIWAEKSGGPNPRELHAMTFDTAQKRLMLFGGAIGPAQHPPDTWIYNPQNDQWVEKSPQDHPSGRVCHGTVYDALNKRTFLFGGYTASLQNDTWVYYVSNNTWIKLNTINAPSKRMEFGMAYDNINNKVVLFGGYGDNGCLNDTWVYDVVTNRWTSMNPPSHPSSRMFPMMSFDQSIGKVFLFGGGLYMTETYNDTWTYDLVTNTWSLMNPSISPSPRFGGSTCFVDSMNEILLFGGRQRFGGWDVSNETWAYDAFADAWTKQPYGISPSARCYSSFVYDDYNNQAILFGGNNGGNFFNDTWMYKFHGYESIGALKSKPITLPESMQYSTLSLTKSELPNTHINVSVIDTSTNATIPGFANLTARNIDLTPLGDLGVTSIRLKAYFSGNGSATPSLDSWGVEWTADNAWRDSFTGDGKCKHPGSFDDNMVASWEFDEGNGNIAHDSSGYDHHCTIENCQWVNQNDRNVLQLSSNSDKIFTNDNIGSFYEGTINIHCYIASINNPGYLFCSQNGGNNGIWGVIDTSGRIQFSNDKLQSNGNFFSPINTITENKWYNITFVWNNDSRQVYVDSKIVSSSSDCAIGQITSLYIFSHHHSSTRCGLIDELTIYNKALPPKEIEDYKEISIHGGQVQLADNNTQFSPISVSNTDTSRLDIQHCVNGGNILFGTQSGYTYKVAQSFQVPTVTRIDNIDVYIRHSQDYLGTADIKMSIVPDVGGFPGDNAVPNGVTTISAFSDQTFKWHSGIFNTPPVLQADVTYWILLEHQGGTGNRGYILGYDSNGLYQKGRAEFYDSGTNQWNIAYPDLSNADAFFRVNSSQKESSSGYIKSNHILLPPNNSWSTLHCSRSVPENTHLNVSVHDATTDEILLNNTNSTAELYLDMMHIDPVAHPSIYLNATFSGNGTATPILYDWAVNWTDERLFHPPSMSLSVPEIEFPEDTVAENAIDLLLHFEDINTPAFPLSYDVVNLVPDGNIQAVLNGTFVSFRTTEKNWSGCENFTINCTNEEGLFTHSNEFTVNVTPVDDPPVWKTAPSPLEVMQGGSVTSTYVLDDHVEDAENDSWEFSALSEDVEAYVTPDNRIRINATGSFIGNTSVSIRVRESANESLFSDIDIPVNVLANARPEVWLIEPPNGTIVADLSVVLRWGMRDIDTPNENITFDLYFGSKGNSSLLVSDIRVMNYTVRDLEENVSYYWYVTPRDETGFGRCLNDTWYFTINTSKEVPLVSYLYPEDGITINTTTVNLSWKPLNLPDEYLSYEVYLGTGGDQGEMVRHTVTCSEFCIIRNLSDNTTYYWKIVPWAGKLQGSSNSGVWRFSIDKAFVPVYDLSWSIDEPVLAVEKGTTLSFGLTIKNTGNIINTVTMEKIGVLANTIALSKTVFSLKPNVNNTTVVNLFTYELDVGNHTIVFLLVHKGGSDRIELPVEITEKVIPPGEHEQEESGGYLIPVIISVLILSLIIIAVFIVLKSRKRKRKNEERDEDENEDDSCEADISDGTVEADIVHLPSVGGKFAPLPMNNANMQPAPVPPFDPRYQFRGPWAEMPLQAPASSGDHLSPFAPPTEAIPGGAGGRAAVPPLPDVPGFDTSELHLPDESPMAASPVSGPGAFLALPPARYLDVTEDQKKVPIDELFLMTNSGLLVQHYSLKRESGLNEDVLASMLTAVKSFILDSLSMVGEENVEDKDLSIDLGKFSVMMAAGRSLNLVAITSRDKKEHVRKQLEKGVNVLDVIFGDVIANWDGDMSKLEGVKPYIESLVKGKFDDEAIKNMEKPAPPPEESPSLPLPPEAIPELPSDRRSVTVSLPDPVKLPDTRRALPEKSEVPLKATMEEPKGADILAALDDILINVPDSRDGSERISGDSEPVPPAPALPTPPGEAEMFRLPLDTTGTEKTSPPPPPVG